MTPKGLIKTIIAIIAAGALAVFLLVTAAAIAGGYWYITSQHMAEIDAIEAQHAAELERVDLATTNLKDKTVEEFYRGRFELCVLMMSRLPSPVEFCRDATIKALENKVHSRTAAEGWNWEHIKMMVGLDSG
jgi:hypothetical protein